MAIFYDLMSLSVGELCSVVINYGDDRICWTGRLLDITPEFFHMEVYNDDDYAYDGEMFGDTTKITTFYIKGEHEDKLMASINKFPGATTNE